MVPVQVQMVSVLVGALFHSDHTNTMAIVKLPFGTLDLLLRASAK